MIISKKTLIFFVNISFLGFINFDQSLYSMQNQDQEEKLSSNIIINKLNSIQEIRNTDEETIEVFSKLIEEYIELAKDPVNQNLDEKKEAIKIATENVLEINSLLEELKENLIKEEELACKLFSLQKEITDTSFNNDHKVTDITDIKDYIEQIRLRIKNKLEDTNNKEKEIEEISAQLSENISKNPKNNLEIENSDQKATMVEIEITDTYKKWFQKLDSQIKHMINSRLENIRENAAFGDQHPIESKCNDLQELKFKPKPGLRIYYMIISYKVKGEIKEILLLLGGDKNSQGGKGNKGGGDISMAKEMYKYIINKKTKNI